MTKEQAKIEYEKIIDESIKEVERIEQEAKKNGTWKMGLDGNRELFTELDKKTIEKNQSAQINDRRIKPKAHCNNAACFFRAKKTKERWCEMAHKHSVYDTDPHFKIDPIIKEIINQSETKL